MIFDAGDFEKSIEEVTAVLLKHGKTPLALGGDHSISYPIVRAFAGRHDRLDVLQFDAPAEIVLDIQVIAVARLRARCKRDRENSGEEARSVGYPSDLQRFTPVLD